MEKKFLHRALMKQKYLKQAMVFDVRQRELQKVLEYSNKNKYSHQFL